MPLGPIEGVAIYAGALLAWGMGLYVLTRGGPRPIPLLTAAATATLATYEVGQALGALAAEPGAWLEWARRTWWAASIAPAIWLALAMALAADEGPDRLRGLTGWGRLVATVALATGLAFAALGTAGETVVRWTEVASPQGPPHVPPGPLFVAYQAYVLACLLGPVVILLVLWRGSAPGSPLRARFGWLVGSAALFLLCGVYITGASGLFGFSALPGQLLLSAGLVAMAWNLARYGALLSGETVRTDLVAFAIAAAGITGGYALLVALFARRDFASLELALPGLLLIMATHALADRQNVALDRLTYGPAPTALRERLRGLADRVVRQPDPVAALVDIREGVDDLLREQGSGAGAAAEAPPEPGSRQDACERGMPTDFRLAVEGALRRMNDLPALSEHALVRRLVAGDSGAAPLDRARELRGLLEAAVARLQPSGPRPPTGNPDGPGAWLHYLVLHEAYAEGRPNKQIMQRHHLSESTFHRARRRAIDAVAEDLWARAMRREGVTAA